MGDESAVTTLNSMAPFLRKNSRVGSGLAMLTVAVAAWDSVKPWIKVGTDLVSHTVKVSEKDDCYEDVERWVLSYLDRKAVKKSRVRFGDTVAVVQSVHSNKPIRFKLDGISIRAQIIDPEPPTSTVGRQPNPGAIIFKTFSPKGYQLLIDKIVTLNDEQKYVKHTPKLFTPTSWGGFRSRAVPARRLESVILKENEIDELVDDLRTFLAAEQRYNELGVPWHRGYLLYGVAGTGKTSIAKALSAEFGLDVYKLSLGDLDGDNTLNDFVENIKPRSVLLLEDVDVFSAATSREAEEHSATLSGLLNVLDGIATPHGLIKILTTNHIESLDEALIRPGRIDVKKEFTALNQDQGERLFEHFYGFRPKNINFNGLLPSAVTSTFVQHLDSPEDAVEALIDLRKNAAP